MAPCRDCPPCDQHDGFHICGLPCFRESLATRRARAWISTGRCTTLATRISASFRRSAFDTTPSAFKLRLVPKEVAAQEGSALELHGRAASSGLGDLDRLGLARSGKTMEAALVVAAVSETLAWESASA